MHNQPDSHRFAVTRLGPNADEVLRRTGNGAVVAVFERSFYIELSGAYACVGTTALCPGPLNAATSAPAATNWSASGVRVGNRVRLYTDGFRVGAHLMFDLGDVERWRPAPFPRNWSPASAAAGLACIDAFAADRAPDEGLGRLLLDTAQLGAETTVLRHAAAPAAALRRWLTAAMQDRCADRHDDLETACTLLGLGPGLTPSGDDLIGGVMITLHALRKCGSLNCLSRIVRRRMRSDTTPISIAHLSAVMNGMCGASVHDALNAVLLGDGASLASALEGVTRIGHTSGWDTLTGIEFALTALIESELVDALVSHLHSFSGYDEPEILSNSIHQICLKGADVRQSDMS